MLVLAGMLLKHTGNVVIRSYTGSNTLDTTLLSSTRLPRSTSTTTGSGTGTNTELQAVGILIAIVVVAVQLIVDAREGVGTDC